MKNIGFEIYFLTINLICKRNNNIDSPISLKNGKNNIDFKNISILEKYIDPMYAFVPKIF